MKAMKLILGAGLLLLHLACSREERNQDKPVVIPPNQARITITLAVNNSSAAHSRMAETPPAAPDTARGVVVQCVASEWGEVVPSAATRSTVVGRVEESVIADVWAIQFDEHNKLVGRPTYQSGLRGKTEVTLMLTQTAAGKEHTVYFVTNTGRADLLTENNVPTLERYRALMHSYENEAAVVASKVLMMTGKYRGALSDNQTLSQPIELTRNVAKIVFSYRTANFDDGTIRILGVQLKSVPRIAAYLEPVDASYPAIGHHADYPPETAPDEASGSYTWYLPENVRGARPTIVWEGNKSKQNAPDGQGDYATQVEVRAQVAGKDGAMRNIIYQFFIGENVTDYSVKRNRHYQLGIDFRGIDESDKRVVTGNFTPWLAPTVGVSDIMGTGATVRATVISDGGSPLTDRGFYVSENKDDIGTTRSYLGGGMYEVGNLPLHLTRAAAFVPEVIERILTGLNRSTTYYVRPYATNSYGTTVGEQATFSTTDAPTIVTVGVSEVKSTTATVTYQITDNGASTVTEQGAVYSTTKDFVPATGTKVASASTVEAKLASLVVKTTYYVRAYATNGDGTSYGKQMTFTTRQSFGFAPVWMTLVPGKYVRAVVGSTGAVAPTEMGVMWSVTDFSNPEMGTLQTGRKVSDTHVVDLAGISAAWYLYPYGKVDDDYSYGATKYSGEMMPTSPKPTSVVDADNNKVTFSVAAQSPGTGSTITDRGIVYSPALDFDPLDTQGISKVPGPTTGIPNLFAVLVENMLPSEYSARSYVVNAAGHTSYSEAITFQIDPKLTVTSSWGKGEDITGWKPPTYKLEFTTNTNWKIEATNATLSESIGEKGTKTVTVTVGRNDYESRDIKLKISTTQNGTLSAITTELKMKQLFNVYRDPIISGNYVDNLLLNELVSWNEAEIICREWGGEFFGFYELQNLFRNGTHGNYGIADEWHHCLGPRNEHYLMKGMDSSINDSDRKGRVRCVRNYY